MNYRHGFHAGNLADCVKHALLHTLLLGLRRKPAPFRVLDAHAGAGLYDLGSEAAARTGEWRDGIGRVAEVREGPLAPWLDAVRSFGPGVYPGSPALTRALLREGDRLVLCERHPEEAEALRSATRGDERVSVHHRDGWEALRALTPFPEGRGLVLLDPPYEAPGEAERLAAGLALVQGRFRAAVQAGWYPIKHRAPVRALREGVRSAGVRDALACELWLREPTDPARLNGCGLIVANAPFGFEAAAGAILADLLPRLSGGEAGAGWSVERVTPE